MSGSIIELDSEDLEDHPEFGYCTKVSCGVIAQEHPYGDNVTFVFNVYQNYKLYYTHTLNVTSREDLMLQSLILFSGICFFLFGTFRLLQLSHWDSLQ